MDVETLNSRFSYSAYLRWWVVVKEGLLLTLKVTGSRWERSFIDDVIEVESKMKVGSLTKVIVIDRSMS